MKKAISFLLALVMLLSLAACASEPSPTTPTTVPSTTPASVTEETETEPTQETEEYYETEEPDVTPTPDSGNQGGGKPSVDEPVVEEPATPPPSGGYEPTLQMPLTMAQINAIPVANASMTVDQLRDICWNFMALQLNIGWRPNDSFVSRERADVTYQAGTLYGGMPYSHKTFANLYNVMYYYDERTGDIDIAKMKANATASSLRDYFTELNDVSIQFANQCSSSTLWAWGRVSDQVSWDGADEVVPKSGAVILGDALSYHVKTRYPALSNYSKDKIYTKTILNSAGEEAVFQAYSLLKKADGLVQYKSSGGHVRMVHHVDVEAKKVYLQEQTYGRENSSTTHPGAYKSVSFATLFNDGYIPFTIPEFVGQSPVEAGSASFSHSGTTVTVSQLLSATTTSPYMISDITVTVKDQSGAQKAEYYYTATVNYNLFAGQSRERTPLKLKGNEKANNLGATEAQYTPYADGTHTVQLRVRISTGEVFTVYRGTLS